MHGYDTSVLTYAADTWMNKKLSYRKDNASRRSLRRSRSFNVTEFNTSGKPVCDFVLKNNTTCDLQFSILSLTVCHRSTDQVISFDRDASL